MSKQPLSPVNDALQLVFLFGDAAVTSPGLLKNRSVWALEEAYRSGEDFDTGWYTCGRDNWLAQIFRSGDTVTCRSVMTASGENDDYEGQYTESIKIAKTTHPQRALKLILEVMTEVSQNAFLDFLRDRERKQKGRNVFYHPIPPPPARNPAALNAAFWKWFGNSVVRNEDGTPMVVYHGTQEEFQEFQLYDACDVPAAFFTDDESTAYTYGEVMPVYLKIENPLVVNAKGRSYKTFVPAHYLPEAVKRGHDGLVIKNIRDDASMGGEPSTTYVIFDNTQVKSVDNDGTWDGNDPNIHSNPDERSESGKLAALLREWLIESEDDLDVEWEIRPRAYWEFSDSVYFFVSPLNEPPRSIEIRISDHAQPKFGGYSVSSGGRRGKSDLSIDPSTGLNLDHAKAAIADLCAGRPAGRERKPRR